MSEARKIELGALALRIALGAMFISHALLKYFVFTLPGTAQFFQSLGLPGALGYVTFAAELIGGALIVAGVYTRVVALMLVPFVIGATWAHSGNGWVFTSPNGGWEYPAFLTMATLALGFIGNGFVKTAPSLSESRNPQTAARAV